MLNTAMIKYRTQKADEAAARNARVERCKHARNLFRDMQLRVATGHGFILGINDMRALLEYAPSDLAE
jgi:hypothetical protein